MNVGVGEGLANFHALKKILNSRSISLGVDRDLREGEVMEWKGNEVSTEGPGWIG